MGSAELLKRHDIRLLLDWEIVSTALRRRLTFKQLFGSTLSISRKVSKYTSLSPCVRGLVTYRFEEYGRDILWVWKVGENATALNDEVANDIEQGVLRP
jgi:hypothetical protein